VRRGHHKKEGACKEDKSSGQTVRAVSHHLKLYSVMLDERRDGFVSEPFCVGTGTL
jgi:hypothetical protein